MKIEVVQQPSEDTLTELGVRSWPQWGCEESVFPWTYDEAETCFFLEGDVIVTPEDGEAERVGAGQLVTFPAGMSCTWDVKTRVRKHYRFG